MAVVKEIHSGVNIVRIHDDCYKDTSPEMVKEIIQRISNQVHQLERRLKTE